MSFDFRPISQEYAEDIFSSISGSVATYFYDFKTLEEVSEWIDGAIEQHELGKKEEYVIFHDNQFIGMISPSFISKTEAEVGMWISEKYQGQGYGKEALQKLIENLKDRNITKMYYETDPENEASIRLARSLDFILEEDTGILRFSKDLT
jgi:RimJ/RimL family protein N-acetyltransferase